VRPLVADSGIIVNTMIAAAAAAAAADADDDNDDDGVFDSSVWLRLMRRGSLPRQRRRSR